MKTASMIYVFDDVLECVNKQRQSSTHALLTMLREFRRNQPLSKSLITADGSFLPGSQILTVIQLANELLGNDHLAAQQLARDLQPLFEMRRFRDPIQADITDDTDHKTALDRDEVGTGAPSR